MVWEIIAGQVLSAGLGAYGAKQAGDAQKDAAKAAQQFQQQQYQAGLRMLEPQRSLGYGALSDLANLYGYALPQYSTIQDLQGAAGGKYPGNTGVGGSNYYGDGLISIEGKAGGRDAKFGGYIDPVSGTVVVDKNPELSAKWTEYLRSGSLPDVAKNQKEWRLFSRVQGLQQSGWKYDPNAAEQAKQPTAGPTGQPGNMDRFFTSPDYQFRLNEGTRAIDRSAAARGSALGGNALRAQTEYAGNLASSEYGNYVNRLMAMAGLGQTATTQGVQTGQNYAVNAGNALQAQGDARASGIMGMTNSVTGAINNGMNLYALQNYLKPPPASVVPQYSPYGPYASGYKF